MKKLNYKGIIDNIMVLASDMLNDWESGFMNDMYSKYYNNIDRLNDNQKEKIRQIQNKYLKHN